MKRTAPRQAFALLTSAAACLTLAAGLLVPAAPTASAAPTVSAAPTLRVSKIVGGLTIPWDVTWVGGTMLYNERPGRLWSKRGNAAPKRVRLALPPIWARSEGGLLGMAADPAAASNGYFYTCMSVASASGTPKAVQVWKWKLTNETTASRVRVMIAALPIGSGRHNGCRLFVRSDRTLYVATGDAAYGGTPQNLQSGGGKILRLNLDGSIPVTNPFYRYGGNARLVWTYGHRNVQGLAIRSNGSLWSVEHGTSRDDEINRVLAGTNYGWSPTPGYNEQRPMTDVSRFPRAKRAAWSSGSPTLAASGATFLNSSKWGTWNGRLAVALLKGQGVQMFTVSTTADVATRHEKVLTSYGRIRTVRQGPDGALYFTTSNGSNDGIYRVATG